MQTLVVAVESDGTVTWEESLTALDPQGTDVDIDAAVPIYVMEPAAFDARPVTVVARRRAA